MAKHAVPLTDTVPLAVPYQRRIGKVTFVVSSFGNPKATDTAQQLLLRLLEEKVTQESGSSVLDCA